MKVSGDQCAEKWRSLVRRYREVKDKLQRSGAGGKMSVRFEHFSALDEVLRDRQSTACTHVVSTLLHCDATSTSEGTATTSTATTSTAIAEASVGTAKASTKSKRHAPEELQKFLVDYLNEKKSRREQREEERKKEREQQFEIENRKLDLFEKFIKLKEQ